MTQDSETKEYMIVMRYAKNGSLLSYLDQNINKLTWKDKLRHLLDIAEYLYNIHRMGLVHWGGVHFIDNHFTDNHFTDKCSPTLFRNILFR